MMINAGGLTKKQIGIIGDTNKGEKRKLSGQNAAQEIKQLGSNTEKPKKAPLKAELIVKLKNLEKEYEALKVENSKHLQTIEDLEIKVASLEKQTKKKDLESENHQKADDLDMSFGPRYCKKCGYQTEDGYQLDGHVWSEHEDSDITSLQCQHCDRKFSTLRDLMTHKKMKHIENVSLCWHFSNGECLFGEETCWFKHEIS